MARRQSGGLITGKPGSPRGYRGSRKRLKRIRFRGNWSTELLLAALTVALTLLVLIPLLLDSTGDAWH
jgi:hypothetical protein